MKRMILAAAWLLVAGLSLLPAEEKLLICNHSNGTAELVDLATLRSLAVRAVAGQPNTAAVTHDRRFALVAAFGTTAPPMLNGSLTIFDLASPGMPVVATVCQNSRVIPVDTLPNSKLAVAGRVTNQNVSEIVLIDLTSSPPAELGPPIPLPNGRSVYAVQVVPDGKNAYVLDFSAATLHVVDLTSSPPVFVHAVGTNPSPIYMRLSNDGRRLVVNNIASPALAGIWNVEAALPVKITNLTVGSNAGSIPAFEPGNRFALVAGASSQDIHVLDTHAAPPVRLGTLGAIDSDLRGITATTSGLYAWVASRGSSRVHEIGLANPAAPALTNRSFVAARGPGHLVAFGEVHAHGIPAVGSSYPVYVSSPADAGKAYLLGASFFPEPGLKIGARTIPLNPDGLFGASQTLPAVFRGFQGVLNPSGQAAAILQIPPVAALRGVSFYVAGVLLDASAPGGIGTITNAEHIVLQ
ncbi:MAG: hypothetical protein JXQ29_13370 [Planctomycetes bacterium]|nr:hypothetical protein [Planctomycetota bacterium]